MSQASYLRPATRTYAPSVILVVIPETYTVRPLDTQGAALVTLRAIHTCLIQRRRKGWTNAEYHQWQDVQAFWDYVENDIKLGRRIHVFAPSVCHALTLSDFWARIEERGCVLEGGMSASVQTQLDAPLKAAAGKGAKPKRARKPAPSDGIYRVKTFSVSQRTEILRYRTFGRSFQWCNFDQYFQSPESEIAAALNWKNPERFGRKNPTPGHDDLCGERSLLWCQLLRQLADWWVEHDGGPWGPTVAACSYSWLRRRVAPKTILQHDDDDAGEIEERAIFGGRRSVWYYGGIGHESEWRTVHERPPSPSPWGWIRGPIHHCDIRSMYPFIMASSRFPVKLQEVRTDWSLSGIAAAAAAHGVIAEVTLFTSRPEYPLRTARGIKWPIGRFKSTLAGPELRLALAAGEVERVHRAAVYELGTPFAAACKPLLSMRQEFRRKGNRCWELFSKMLGNSMSGRIALKPHVMAPRPYTPAPCDWGWWRQDFPETGEVRQFRTWAGMTWERIEAERENRAMGAAYAYLTSYGRALMRSIRDTAGPRESIAMDTDGVWLTAAGAANVYNGEPKESEAAGTLTLTHTTNVARWWSPQHYWFGAGWVLSGVCLSGSAPVGDVVVSHERPNPLMGAKRRPEPVVMERRIERTLSTMNQHDIIGPDGWAEPMRLWFIPSADAGRPAGRPAN